jgi:hypothetical protein
MNEVSNPNPVGLLGGLTYSVPIDGVVRMGRAVERGGKRLPQKDDQFTITRKFKLGGNWVAHPVDAKLRDQYGEDDGNGQKKLRRIPVRIAFDTPGLSMSEQFAVFSVEGRPVCVGNGCKGKRRDVNGTMAEVECPGPDGCEFGQQYRCDALVRLLVQIDDPVADGGHFILRSGSINAVTDCRTVLESLAKVFGGTLAGVPMWLTLEAKSSSLSRQTVFWYASLRPRFPSLIEGAKLIRKLRQEEVDAGIDRASYEAMLLALRNNGTFAETSEDSEQFEDLLVARFSDEGDDGRRQVEIAGPRDSTALSTTMANLGQRLTEQSQGGKGPGANAEDQAGAMFGGSATDAGTGSPAALQ